MVDSVINTTIDRARHKVLVVDDNPATRYSTARVVRAAGFMAEEAGTGAEALAAAQTGVSAVVLDVHLPDMDGFAVCQAIRANAQIAMLPVIHLSAAFVKNEDKVTGLNAGADAYLVHPVEPAVLIATLQALIRARLAEDSLRASESRFRAIYNQAPTGMALIDAEGRFADVNPALAGMLDLPREELVGSAVTAFVPPERQTDVALHTIGAPTPPGVWRGQFPLLRRDGSVARLEWTLTADIEPGLRLAMAVDISERFELESRRHDVLEREQAARATAERLNRTKDDFVAVLSHELRNPLNAIAGWVHVLRSHARTAEMVEKGLNAIERSMQAQARLISDILDVSRISSGKLRLHPEWVEPGALVASSIEALASAADAKRISVVLEGEAQECTAWLDPTRFQQIVWNLLSNAIKFSFEGGRVRVVMRREHEWLHLSVHDEGRGIERDFLDHLFDRFTQSDSPDNRQHGGLGLGLSIVKNLAELHGGRAGAHSEGPGRGATLEVALRAVPAEGATIILSEAAAAQPLEPIQAGRPLAELHVLVVEDDPDAREILAVVLGDAGAQVRTAAHFEQAIEALAAQRPDVLVSDVGLPGRDGYDLARALREQEHAQGLPRLFAIALTAFSRPQDQSKALDSGFDVHMAKPLQPHALVQLVGSRRQG